MRFLDRGNVAQGWTLSRNRGTGARVHVCAEAATQCPLAQDESSKLFMRGSSWQ